MQQSHGQYVDLSSNSPPVKCPRLLSCYKAHKKRSSGQDSSIATQISKYFDAIQDSDIDNALVLWAKYNDRFPQLYKLALKVLSVPATSAPMERVFSQGGLMMRPHRARLGHKMLQSFIFLKCNQTLLASCLPCYFTEHCWLVYSVDYYTAGLTKTLQMAVHLK